MTVERPYRTERPARTHARAMEGRSRRFIVLWTAWMCAGAIAAAVVAYAITGSVG
jgi:hypothetical protein